MAQPSLLAQIEALTATWEPVVRDAFLEAVREIVSRAEIGRIIEALERGDIEAALAAVHFDGAAFAPVAEAVRQAYVAGGVNAVAGAPTTLTTPAGARVIVRFDTRVPRAERWLAEQSSEFVRGVTADALEGMRSMLVSSLEAGRGPRSTALDLVGRQNPVTKRREGGIVGLTATQTQWVLTARAELSDPATMARFLQRSDSMRDRRLDRTITKAIREGKRLDSATVNKIVGRYADKLLKYRGEMISRTETLSALNAARDEAQRQIRDAGAQEECFKVWKTASDRRVRHSHRAIHNERVPLDGRFSNGLLYPHEKGAAAREVVACRCIVSYEWDYIGAAARREREPA